MSLKGISKIPAAKACGVDDTVQSVLQWISVMQEQWLIVFDNADDPPPEVVARFLPSGDRGNILITSRSRSMGRIISFKNSIEITEMEESDAITLLLKTSCLDAAGHLQAAQKIVAELGCIPLAVHHAGAYIEAGRCDINNYLRQFFLHRQTLMSDATFTGASNYDRTVYGTWDLSFKEIEKRANGQSSIGNAQAAQAAILILQICAFYHHSNISKEIFQSAAEQSRQHTVDSEVAEKLPLAATLLNCTLLTLDNDGYWDDFHFGQGISVLLSFSLIKRAHSSEFFSVHPLVHSWSQEKIPEHEQQRIWQMASIILSCATPRGFTSQNYALRHLIFPHIKANELHGHQLGCVNQYYDDKYTNFALVMEENGDWKNAEQLQVEVMNMRKKVLGTEHVYTLLSMANVASIYVGQGRWNEAEQLQVQVMDKMKKVLGAEHRETLTIMADLARTYRNQGRWNDAEQLEVQVLAMTRRSLGVEHPDTLSSMGNLARTYRSQGRLKKAEQLEIQVMDLRKKQLGIEHPDTLASIGNLANTYRDQGRLSEAEQLDTQVVSMMKKLLGVEHPHTLTSMSNLAITYLYQERWNEAEQLNVQVMDIRKKFLGAEHPDTLFSMAGLASTYSSQGRWNKSEQLSVQVIDMMKKVFGEEHPDTLLTMGNLADTYQHQGRWNEAEQLAVQLSDITKKSLGMEHPQTLTSMGKLANIYWAQGRRNEAEQLNVQLINARKKLLGAEYPELFCAE